MKSKVTHTIYMVIVLTLFQCCTVQRNLKSLKDRLIDFEMNSFVSNSEYHADHLGSVTYVTGGDAARWVSEKYVVRCQWHKISQTFSSIC